MAAQPLSPEKIARRTVAGAPMKLEWNPSLKTYRARCLQQLKVPGRPRVLPDAFPQRLESPLAWTARDLDEVEYVVRLTPEDVEEANAALQYFAALELPTSEVNQQTFPLPRLGEKLRALRSTLYHGRGFFVLRGLEPINHTPYENIVLYAGMASHVAEKRGRQDEHNNYLLHLIDLGAETAPDSLRQAPYSNVEQPFHTDTGDILALYALETAPKGGRSKLASSAQIYNDLAALRPDHVHTLSSPWPFDSFSAAVDATVPPYRERPLLFHQDGRVILSFSRRPLTGSKVSPRTPGIPSLTEAQAEALDAVHFTAERHALVLNQQRGDMQFWNNLSIVHGREGFEDSATQKRHLVRLWLRDPAEAWPLPAELQEQWNNAYGENARPEKWPVSPIRDFAHITTQRRSSGHG